MIVGEGVDRASWRVAFGTGIAFPTSYLFVFLIEIEVIELLVHVRKSPQGEGTSSTHRCGLEAMHCFYKIPSNIQRYRPTT